MAKKSVVDYVRAQIQKGYSASAIRDVMLKYGYSSNDINEALDEIYHPTIRHEIHLSKTTIIAIALIFILSIGTFSFFYFKSSPSSKLLDVNLKPVDTTANPGEAISFVKELSNLGSSKRFDVVVKQEILDKNFKVLTEKTETRAIETFGSTPTEMIVPSDAKAGDYTLRLIVEYDGKKAIATLPVKITESAAAKEEISQETIPVKETEKIDCSDNNACTEDIEADGKCSYKKIVPCCGNIICEENENCASDCKKETVDVPSNPTVTEETPEDTNSLAKTDPNKAMQQCSKMQVPDNKDTCIGDVAESQADKSYCTQIINPKIKDLCYYNVAKASKDKEICSLIGADAKKDSCYMHFAIDLKDYSVCSLIVQQQQKDSCYTLKQIYEISRT